jgi:histone deacetylase HOS2
VTMKATYIISSSFILTIVISCYLVLRKMATSMSPSDIVQEYKSDRSNLEFLRLIKAEVEKNSIKRPKGYTVSFHLNPDIEKHYFGRTHPMKPWRLTLTNGLIMAYGMHYAMDTYKSRRATVEELEEFHTQDYLDYLRTVKSQKPQQYPTHPFNLGGDDCPLFEKLFDYCVMYFGVFIDVV